MIAVRRLLIISVAISQASLHGSKKKIISSKAQCGASTKLKPQKTVKEVISDEEIEKMRDKCKNLRDLAIIDLLYSTGIRIGELVRLNIDDIDFEERECIVFGKGDKERRVYFDAKTKIHLMGYINSRSDTNPALFVTLDATLR